MEPPIKKKGLHAIFIGLRSKIDFVGFTSELRHLTEKVEELRQLIISLTHNK